MACRLSLRTWVQIGYQVRRPDTPLLPPKFGLATGGSGLNFSRPVLVHDGARHGFLTPPFLILSVLALSTFWSRTLPALPFAS